MQIGIVSLFPEMFSALEAGIVGRALESNLIQLQTWNPRDYSDNNHRQVDDRPYGGGPGMVLQAPPLASAIDAAKHSLGAQTKVIYLSPRGRTFNHAAASHFSKQASLVFVSGRYEGIDERVVKTHIDEEWSLGDFVLSGGELAVMVMIDAITRLIPGALGDAESAACDSFATGILDHPHYTRPEEFAGIKVPDVLTSGDHARIQRWRMKQALGQTYVKRPDLLEQISLSATERTLLQEYIEETRENRGATSHEHH